MIRPRLAALLLALSCLTPALADDKPATAPAPNETKLYLMDGSVLGGKLGSEFIEVQTKYGLLKIPLADIRSFTPGLGSHSEYNDKLNALINDLGADKFDTREDASKALSKMGPEIRGELDRALKTAETEKQARLTKLIEEIDSSKSADDDTTVEIWNRLDTIVTPDFTVAGQITTKSFAFASNYGPLTVKLGDIKSLKREDAAPEEIHKEIKVAGGLVQQRSFENSNIKLNKGDTVIVTASGSILMQPWGNNATSGPDGGGNFGMQQPGNLTGGALIAKINSTGTLFKVGAKNQFTATSAGTLMFSIAMQQDYLNYAFPGDYTVKIRVIRKPQ